MIDAAIQSELLKEVEQLPPPLQQKVVDFAHSLAQPRPRGTPGDELLQFAGIMTPSEADEFLRGIEQDCERVDPNEW
jgi:hypothetical protein